MNALTKYGFYFFAIVLMFDCIRGYLILDRKKLDDVLDDDKPKDVYSALDELSLLKLLRRPKLEDNILFEDFNQLGNQEQEVGNEHQMTLIECPNKTETGPSISGRGVQPRLGVGLRDGRVTRSLQFKDSIDSFHQESQIQMHPAKEWFVSDMDASYFEEGSDHACFNVD